VVLDDDCLTDRRRQEVHVEEQGLCDALCMYLHPCFVSTIIIFYHFLSWWKNSASVMPSACEYLLVLFASIHLLLIGTIY
jgi:hypothetical protein